MTSVDQIPREQRLRVMFLLTSMPVGGAETLLASLVRGLDPRRFAPEVTCLKQRGPLGEELAAEFPVHSELLSNKFDLRVLPRLWRLLRDRQIDAVVTVGAGDKMFWGRIAARLAGVPVVVSALHSTGWPDSVGRLNRLLTPLTDAFIGVADSHAEHLVAHEHFPRDKVSTIYNGVDTERFVPHDGTAIKLELGLPLQSQVVAILAALRPEKNHALFLRGAQRIAMRLPDTQFLVVGDGPLRRELESLASHLDIADRTHFLGSRGDVPALLSACDILALTSHNEASPVSVLEALSCGVPVVASHVGSIPETVVPDETGFLFPPGDEDAFVLATLELLTNHPLRERLGGEGRQRVVAQRSLPAMVNGYADLLETLWQRSRQERHNGSAPQIAGRASRGMYRAAPR